MWDEGLYMKTTNGEYKYITYIPNIDFSLEHYTEKRRIRRAKNRVI